MQQNNSKWKFAVDRGGTFTDVIGQEPCGTFHTLKLLSQSPEYKDASIEGIRRILYEQKKQELSGRHVESIRFGTTVATNALLERKGGKVALITTRGFRDLLEIGYQARPRIFDLAINKPSQLYSVVIEVEERVNKSGNIIENINLDQIEEISRRLKNENINAVAVVFLHSWKNPGYNVFWGGNFLALAP